MSAALSYYQRPNPNQDSITRAMQAGDLLDVLSTGGYKNVPGVYFLWIRDLGVIKIGRAKDLDDRLRDYLPYYDDLRLLGVILSESLSERELETAMHFKFSDLRAKKGTGTEFFKFDDKLLGYIKKE